jgi:hypothetical protein
MNRSHRRMIYIPEKLVKAPLPDWQHIQQILYYSIKDYDLDGRMQYKQCWKELNGHEEEQQSHTAGRKRHHRMRGFNIDGIACYCASSKWNKRYSMYLLTCVASKRSTLYNLKYDGDNWKIRQWSYVVELKHVLNLEHEYQWCHQCMEKRMLLRGFSCIRCTLCWRCYSALHRNVKQLHILTPSNAMVINLTR